MKNTDREVYGVLFSDHEDISLAIDKKSLIPATSSLLATDVTDKGVGNKRQYYLFVHDWRKGNIELPL